MKQNGWEVLNLNVPADEPKNKYLYKHTRKSIK